MKKTLLVIAGPTASGKTVLSIDLALRFNTEILSADSRQVYQEMNIGTAKPSFEQLQLVKHHFINTHTVTELFNAGLFAQQGLSLLNQLFKIHPVVILAGGSGLYIDALLNGMDDLPEGDETIRLQLTTDYEKKGLLFLQEQLHTLDLASYQTIDLANPQRLMRALEVCLLSGKPYSSFLTGSPQALPFDVLYFCLERPRQELYQRINERVDQMISLGLLEEVTSLLAYKNHPAMKTVGYQELVTFLEGSCSMEAAIEKIKQHSRNYAKRQITWFKKRKDIIFIHPNQQNIIMDIITKKYQ